MDHPFIKMLVYDFIVTEHEMLQAWLLKQISNFILDFAYYVILLLLA